MTKIKQLTNVLALCTIVGLSCWVSLLAASKRDAEYELFIYKQHSDSINNANIENHIKDSIRNEFCPEVKVEKDSEGNYTFYYN